MVGFALKPAGTEWNTQYDKDLAKILLKLREGRHVVGYQGGAHRARHERQVAGRRSAGVPGANRLRSPLADPTGRSAYFLSAGLASPFGPVPAFFAGATGFASGFGVQNSGSRATNSFEG